MREVLGWVLMVPVALAWFVFLALSLRVPRCEICARRAWLTVQLLRGGGPMDVCRKCRKDLKQRNLIHT